MAFIKFKLEKDKEERAIKTLKLGGKGKTGETPKIKAKRKVKTSTGKKGFILDWESELGYSANPFETKILAPISSYIAGYSKEKNGINLFVINNEKFGIITGEYGVGKTTLLKWLHEQLQKYKERVMVYYFNGKVLFQEFILVKSLVNPLLSLYEKKIKKLNKDVNIERNLSLLKKKIGNKKLVLLIDDVESVPSSVLLLLKKMYSVMPLEIIMVCNSHAAQKLREIDWLKDRLKMKLKGLAVPEATVMIRKRITAFGGEDIFPFDDSYVHKICKQASYNPKQILDLCQHYAIELAVKQVKRKIQNKAEVVKEEVKEEKSVKEEVKDEEQNSEVPVLKEIPKRKEYHIKVINQGSEAISMDDLKKDEKGNYNKKISKKKKKKKKLLK